MPHVRSSTSSSAEFEFHEKAPELSLAWNSLYNLLYQEPELWQHVETIYHDPQKIMGKKEVYTAQTEHFLEEVGLHVSQYDNGTTSGEAILLGSVLEMFGKSNTLNDRYRGFYTEGDKKFAVIAEKDDICKNVTLLVWALGSDEDGNVDRLVPLNPYSKGSYATLVGKIREHIASRGVSRMLHLNRLKGTLALQKLDPVPGY